MTERLPDALTDELLLALERALIDIRMACYEGDVKRAEAIADAFHNLPRLLMSERPAGWSVGAFVMCFLAPLGDDYAAMSRRLLERSRPSR
ncbi:MAG TPA: hypothetical protein VFS43_04760 [Polyangiaceae bacterium]|nr:hypothetical protein [Polyangiaceae bacterium]